MKNRAAYAMDHPKEMFAIANLPSAESRASKVSHASFVLL